MNDGGLFKHLKSRWILKDYNDNFYRLAAGHVRSLADIWNAKQLQPSFLFSTN